VNNIVHSFRLTETSFDKKSYMTYLGKEVQVTPFAHSESAGKRTHPFK
jgi:hypothetical protein